MAIHARSQESFCVSDVDLQGEGEGLTEFNVALGVTSAGNPIKCSKSCDLSARGCSAIKSLFCAPGAERIVHGT